MRSPPWTLDTAAAAERINVGKPYSAGESNIESQWHQALISGPMLALPTARTSNAEEADDASQDFADDHGAGAGGGLRAAGRRQRVQERAAPAGLDQDPGPERRVEHRAAAGSGPGREH